MISVFLFQVADHLMKILRQLEDITYASIYTTCLIKPSSCVWYISYSEKEMEQIKNIGTCADDLIELPLFRVRQEISINWLKSSGNEGLQAEIDKLDKELIGYKPAYLVNDVRMILHNDDNGAALPELSCRDIVDELKSNLGVKQWPPIKKPLANIVDVTGLSRLSTTRIPYGNDESGETNEDDSAELKPICSVPVLLSHKVIGERTVIKMCVDAFVSAPLDTPGHTLLYMLRDAVFRQQNALCLLLKTDQLNRLYAPFHFLVEGNKNIPLTLMLPSCNIKGEDVAEDSYVDYRKSLHKRYLLPDDRAIFRKVLAAFSGRSYGNNHLINPHEGLTEPDVDGGKIALVHGKYAYHHYLQDNFNDNIWGCAYRSLQTVASWFWLQGYTEKTYPSHKEIQETLVAMGDKEPSFIDSKEWIGSIEVSYCMDSLYGVTSKTLHCSMGSELAYRGRELYSHFVNEGTPIMIGGGVYAHTIVGVKYNEHTGAIKFLIVDPHFTGKDQLKTIQSKGWVGWKGPDFWNQTAHYNLCMPQRPHLI